jgi:hypothetical protein
MSSLLVSYPYRRLLNYFQFLLFWYFYCVTPEILVSIDLRSKTNLNFQTLGFFFCQYHSIINGAELFSKSPQLCSPSQHFMEVGGSSPCSQEPSTGPNSEQDRFSPKHPILSLLKSILLLSTHLCISLPSGFFPFGFPTTPYMHFYSPPFVLHALPISSSLTWSF